MVWVTGHGDHFPFHKASDLAQRSQVQILPPLRISGSEYTDSEPESICETTAITEAADRLGDPWTAAATINSAEDGWCGALGCAAGTRSTVAALAIGAYIAVRAVILGREVLAVLGQHAPAGVARDQVTADLIALDGVQDVHDRHLWTLTSGMHVATAHLVTTEPTRSRRASAASARFC